MNTITFEAFALHPEARTLIRAATRQYGLAEVEVERHTAMDGTVFWTKTLPLLLDGFGIGVYLTEEPLDSLGLFVANKLQPDSFSWEFFMPKTGDVFFNKLCPSCIRVSIPAGASGLELRSLEFLSDYSLRYIDDPVRRDGEFTHEFLVKKGSVLALAQ
jgi:hypothetical protein